MRLYFPPHITMLNAQGAEYHPDSDGGFEVTNPQHIESLKTMGATEEPRKEGPDEGDKEPDSKVDGVPQEHHDAVLNENRGLNSKVEVLTRQVNDLMAENDKLRTDAVAHQAGVGSGAAPAGSSGTSGALGDTSSTSSPQGQAGDNIDKDGAKLALLLKNPPAADATRDTMVTWLKELGISVPGNISQANARKIVDETTSDFQQAQADAAQARQDAGNDTEN